MVPEHKFSSEQAALYDTMSEISEDCWSAGWMIGNEHAIWSALQAGDTRYGMTRMDPELLEKCRALSEQLGGWIIWLDNDCDENLPVDQWGPYFVDMDQWLTIHRGDVVSVPAELAQSKRGGE